MKSNEITLDGDGVLFNYNLGVALLYKEVFCKDAKHILPGAYHVTNEYDLSSEKMTAGTFSEHMYTLFNKRKLWERLPAIEGAKEAIDIMVEKGYEVNCLTSMPVEYEKQRLNNAKLHGMKITKVKAVDRSYAKSKGISNPKLKYIQENEPYAFIDDLLKNFLDMEEVKKGGKTQLIWLDNSYVDNPNEKYDQNMVTRVITSLLEFAKALPVYEETEEIELQKPKKIHTKQEV